MSNPPERIFEQDFCERFKVLLQREGAGAKIMISSETDISVLNYVQRVLSGQPKVERLSAEQLRSIMHQQFADDGDENDIGGGTETTMAAGSSNNKVVDRINNIITESIASRASDIHFEPQERQMLCRARVDGILVTKQSIVRDEVAETVSRIKIMAGLDIAEKRRPQDGRIRYPHENRIVDIRVSIIPTDFGEKAVLRILDKKSLRLNLESLGFSDCQLTAFKNGIEAPNGIVLVTGPTGSGKTTTLYAAITYLKSPDLNISTVEDPIEYNLEGINQTQVKPEINLTFSSMLRALLRQDPDILMVGEIRDRETLDIAIRASLTGHLVLSTIHTNNAIATLSRLADMGGERPLLASTIKVIVAQRLVRQNCPRCSELGLDDNNVVAAKKLNIPLGDKVKKGKGCPYCNHIGFRGRTAIYEVLHVNEPLRDAITAGKSESEILKVAIENGFETMVHVAQNVINAGITTPAEVLREINL